MCSLQPRRSKEISNRNWCRNLQKWMLFHWKIADFMEIHHWFRPCWLKSSESGGIHQRTPPTVGVKIVHEKTWVPQYFLGFLDAYYSNRLVNLWSDLLWPPNFHRQLPQLMAPASSIGRSPWWKFRGGRFRYHPSFWGDATRKIWGYPLVAM